MIEEQITKRQNALAEYLLKDACFVGDNLSTLQYVLQDAAVGFGTQLKYYCSDDLCTGIKSLESFKVDDFSSLIKKDALIVQLWVERWNSNILFILDTYLVNFITDVFFGNPEPQIKSRGNRLFSPVEVKVAEMVALSMIGSLNNIFAEGKNFLEIVSITSSSDFNYEEFSIAHFFCCTLGINYKIVGAELQIILPHSCQRPIQESITRVLHASETDNDPLWAQRMRQEVSRMHITIEAFISQGQITLGELSKFSVGQVLALPINATHQVRLRSRQKQLYKCSLGKIGNSFSVCINDIVDEEKEMLDELVYN